MSPTLVATDALGMLGAAMVMVAYALNQAGRLASADLRFPAANLAGSVLILVSLLFAFNLPAFVIEIFWIAISLYGIGRARATSRQLPLRPRGRRGPG